MVQTLQKVLENMLDHLYKIVTTYLPSLLAAVIVFVAAYLMATVARWLLYRIFKGPAIDRFLRQSGLAFVLDPSGRLRATRLVAETVYWGLLLSGFLLGLSVFDTNITSQIIESLVFLMPKVIIAGLILLGGTWLGQYLGRAMLVWAVNEGIPGARRLSMLVRVVVIFVAVVVAADQLDFARSVFLAAFVILVGGGALTASLAIGLSRDGLRRLLEVQKDRESGDHERSLWNHL
jgi:hypothetical protein